MACCMEESETQQVHLVPAVSHIAPQWSGRAVVINKNKKAGDPKFLLINLSSQSYAGKYLVLLFYPYDFASVCPTELIQFSDRIDEFQPIDAEVVAISTDSENSHLAWIRMPQDKGGIGEMKIPFLSDKSQRITKSYGVLNESEGIAYRALFVIDKNQIIRHVTINYDITRVVDEVLRVLKACYFMEPTGKMCLMNH